MEVWLVADGRVRVLDLDYEAHFRDLTSLSRALGGGADSEDIAQDALIYARQHIGELRDSAALRSWLRRIAARKVYRVRAKNKQAQAYIEIALVPVDRDLGLDLAASIGRLSERERSVLTLTYHLGYRQDEVAAALGIRRGTVAATLHHARRKLVESLAVYRPGGTI
jgi:RNA polymerase sigma factor (sigma-70 family)